MESGFETDTFEPHPFLWNGHLQTIVPSYIKRPYPQDWNDSRERIYSLSDGSAVSCRYLVRDSSAPTLFILHGMAGSNRSRYVRGLVEKTRLLGWNFVGPSLYDVSSKHKPTVFHSGCSRLVSEVLHQAHQDMNLGRVYLAGVSMGGNILLKMIGEWGDEPPAWVRGAAAISPLTDLVGSCRKLDRPACFIYRKRFVRNLQDTMLRDAVRYQNYLDSARVMKARSIREFDQAFTVPLSGFASPDEYYQTQGAQDHLASIRIPAYIIHSLDDPVLTSSGLESEAVRGNPWITLCLTRHGGHVGFVASRPGENRFWAEARIIEFLSRLERKEN